MIEPSFVLTETSMEAIGRRLAFARVRAGVSSREASMLLGLHIHALLKYEQGQRPVRWRLLEELERFFPLDPMWVFYGDLLPVVEPVVRRMREEVPEGVSVMHPALRLLLSKNKFTNPDRIRHAARMKARRGYVPPQVMSAHTGIPMFYAPWLPEGVRGAYIGGEEAAVFLRPGDEAYYFHALHHIVARGDRVGVCFEATPEWERSVERLGLLLAYGRGLRGDIRLAEEHYGPRGVEAIARTLGVPVERLREV